jgi:hypothetical protein
MLHRWRWLLLAALVFLIAIPQVLHASDGDRVSVGHSIDVGENENAGNVVCIGCSARVEGTSGDVVVIGGTARVEGTVKGDVVTIGGGILLGENASVYGDVVTVGGTLSRHPNAMVKGTISAQSGVLVLVGVFLFPVILLILLIALIVWLVSRSRRPAPARVRNQY